MSAASRSSRQAEALSPSSTCACLLKGLFPCTLPEGLCHCSCYEPVAGMCLKWLCLMEMLAFLSIPPIPSPMLPGCGSRCELSANYSMPACHDRLLALRATGSNDSSFYKSSSRKSPWSWCSHSNRKVAKTNAVAECEVVIFSCLSLQSVGSIQQPLFSYPHSNYFAFVEAASKTGFGKHWFRTYTGFLTGEVPHPTHSNAPKHVIYTDTLPLSA